MFKKFKKTKASERKEVLEILESQTDKNVFNGEDILPTPAIIPANIIDDKLSFPDVINNVISELEFAIDFIKNSETYTVTSEGILTEEEMIVEDMENSITRLHTIKEEYEKLVSASSQVVEVPDKPITTKQKHPDLNPDTIALIKKALNKAREKGDEILFKVWDEWDRDMGNPSHEVINPTGIEWNKYFGQEDNLLHPNFMGDGCTELYITEQEFEEMFILWYADNDEDWVFVRDIMEYLDI